MFISHRPKALVYSLIVFSLTIGLIHFNNLPRQSQKPVPIYPPPCTPEVYSAGSWHRRPDAMIMKSENDVYAVSGFTGGACATNRDRNWHLGLEQQTDWDWRGNASAYEWRSGPGCPIGMSASPQEEMIVSMVEKGGWLLHGDSLTQEQFFSIGCMLYPHVIATPDWAYIPVTDRGHQENMYLNPTSPLVKSLRFPKGFDVKRTPLVTYQRNDLLFNQTELEVLYRRSPRSSKDGPLFSTDGSWNMSPFDYMKEFLSPLPGHNYHTLIVNTGGHWTPGLFKGIKTGDLGILDFFRIAVTEWVYLAARSLDKDKSRTKEILVRAYLPGTKDCHTKEVHMGGPLEEINEEANRLYNWQWLPLMNDVFDATIRERNHPRLHFLGIDRPGRLRPDAHNPGDCLHMTVGAGVIEGWTQYMYYFLSTYLPTYRGPPSS